MTESMTSQPLLVASSLTGGSHNTIQHPDAPVAVTSASDQRVGEVGGVTAHPDDVLTRDVALHTIPITAGDTTAVPIILIQPFKDFLADPVVARNLAPYSHIKGELIITARTVVPGLLLGGYNLEAICDGGVDPYDPVAPYPAISRFRSTQDLHAMINCEESNSVELTLPFVSDDDAISLITPYQRPDTWTLALWCMKQPQSVNGGTTSGTIQIVARLAPGYEVYGLRYQGSLSKSFGVARDKKTASKVVGGLSKIADALSGLPVIGAFAGPAAQGLAAAADAFAALGFTRDASPQMPTPFIPRMASTLATMDSPDTGEIVAFSVSNAVSIDPTIGFGTSEDPSSFASLFPRWTITDIFDIPTTALAGSVLYRVPVNPGHLAKTLNAWELSPAAGVGMVHNFWRGGMEYMVYVFSSSYCQGELDVFWTPVALGAVPVDPLNRVSICTIDLCSSSRVRLNVGWGQHRPCGRFRLTTGSTQCYDLEDNGQLTFRVRTPLVAPSSTVTLRVLLLARAAPDMRFWCPANGVLVQDVTDRMPLAGARYQAGGEDGSPNEEIAMILAPNDRPYNVPAILAGEAVESVSALMQVFNAYATRVTPDEGGRYYVHLPGRLNGPYAANESLLDANGPMSLYPVLGTDNAQAPYNIQTGPLSAFTYLGFFSTWFTGIRGGIRWKVFLARKVTWYVTGSTATATTTKNTQRVAAALNLPITDAELALPFPGSTLHTDMQTIDIKNAGEWTFPYYGEKRYSPGFLPQFHAANPELWPRSLIFEESPGISVLNFYVAGSSDIRPTRFRKLPSVTLFPVNYVP